LTFICFGEDPEGVAYHHKWKTALDSEDDDVQVVDNEDANVEGPQPSRCLVM